MSPLAPHRPLLAVALACLLAHGAGAALALLCSDPGPGSPRAVSRVAPAERELAEPSDAGMPPSGLADSGRPRNRPEPSRRSAPGESQSAVTGSGPAHAAPTASPPVRDRRAATLLGIGLAALAALWARRRFARSWAQGPAARPPAGPKRGEAQAGVRRSSAGGRWLLSAAAGVLLLGWCGVRGARAALGPIAEPSASAEWPWPLVGQLERRQGCLRLRLPSGELWPDELRFAEAVPRSGEPLALLGPGQRRPFAQGPASPRRAPFGVLELEPDEVLRLEGGRPNLWSRLDLWASDRRGALEQRLVRAGGDPGTGLGRALLLGDRSGMDAEISDLFRRTGTAHLLALSGMHVSLLFAALLWPGACGLARLGQRLLPGADGLWSRLPTALALTGLCVFAWLAGAASPVLRASLCCALALRGRGRLRTDRPPPAPADGRTLFAAALLFELSLDPGAVLELATVLSYASTAGLIWLYAPLQRLLRGRATGSAPRLAAAGPLAVWARAGAGRLKGFLIGGLAATLAAQLMTLPWQWLVFRELTWAAGPATLTGLVLMTAWLPLLWAAALLESSALGACSRFVEGCQLALLEAFDRMPGTPWVVPEKPTLLVLGLCAATLWALLRRSAMAARIASAAGALLLLPGGPTPAQGELVALDVGHGSALCLRMPGLPALVFDAGSRDRPGLGRRALAPLLARWDPGSLVLVSSHLDQDHSAALPWLRSRWPVELLAGAPAWPGSPPRHDLFAGRSSLPLPRCTVPLSLLRAGEGDRNEGSRSLLVELPGSALLLFGDSVGAGLLGLLDAGLLPERAALALAPHHGSDGPGIGPWLDRWPPETVWISGPAGAPLEAELERRGLPWRSTGRQGWLALEFGPGSRDPPAVGR